MSKKKAETKKTVEAEAVNAVVHGYESHLAFIQHTTEAWEELTSALDVIDVLSGDDEKVQAIANEAKAGIAYRLLLDIQLLKELYECMFLKVHGDATAK